MAAMEAHMLWHFREGWTGLGQVGKHADDIKSPYNDVEERRDFLFIVISMKGGGTDHCHHR